MTEQNFNGQGLYVTDGTKVIVLSSTTTTNNNGLLVLTANDHTYTGASITASPGISLSPGLIYLKVRDDGVNLTWSWGIDGTNFLPVYQAGHTAFLTATKVGFFVDGHSSVVPAAMNLISWLQGT
jgi:hypothetical protein